MFGLFKKKSLIDQLQNKYEKVLKEAYQLSTIDRKESDKKYAEADTIMQKIEALKSSKIV